MVVPRGNWLFSLRPGNVAGELHNSQGEHGPSLRSLHCQMHMECSSPWNTTARWAAKQNGSRHCFLRDRAEGTMVDAPHGRRESPTLNLDWYGWASKSLSSSANHDIEGDRFRAFGEVQSANFHHTQASCGSTDPRTNNRQARLHYPRTLARLHDAGEHLVNITIFREIRESFSTLWR